MLWAVKIFQIIVGALFFAGGFLLCKDAELWEALVVACLFTLVWCELFMDKEGYRE